MINFLWFAGSPFVRHPEWTSCLKGAIYINVHFHCLNLFMLLMETYCWAFSTDYQPYCFNGSFSRCKFKMSQLSANQIRIGITFTYICIFQRDYRLQGATISSCFEYQNPGSVVVPVRSGARFSSMQITNVLLHPNRLSYSTLMNQAGRHLTLVCSHSAYCLNVPLCAIPFDTLADVVISKWSIKNPESLFFL